MSDDDLKEIAGQAEQYRLKLAEIVSAQNMDALEASILLPDLNCDEINETINFYKTEQLKYVIVIGIGGSVLGTQAIYNALQKSNYGNGDKPQMLFIDAIDERRIAGILSLLDKNIKTADEIIINIVSKSGKTVETMANFEILADELSKRFCDILPRVVATTDENSRLWKIAREKNIKTLIIPKTVGGKFSVFSAVGLFPLGLCGIDISELLDGAREARAVCLEKELKNNPALAQTAVLYAHLKQGKNIHNNFFFNPAMEFVGRWGRQLAGESIGNKKGLDGATANAGWTPIVSIGSTDMHSMSQLYLEGPKDKITTFIFSSASKYNLQTPENGIFNLDGIAKMPAVKLADIIYQSVKIAYLKEKLPFMEIQLDTISARTLGAFLQIQMMGIMYIAQLLNVNAFDQPSVELYKKEMREKLSGN